MFALSELTEANVDNSRVIFHPRQPGYAEMLSPSKYIALMSGEVIVNAQTASVTMETWNCYPAASLVGNQ